MTGKDLGDGELTDTSAADCFSNNTALSNTAPPPPQSRRRLLIINISVGMQRRLTRNARLL